MHVYYNDLLSGPRGQGHGAVLVGFGQDEAESLITQRHWSLACCNLSIIWLRSQHHIIVITWLTMKKVVALLTTPVTRTTEETSNIMTTLIILCQLSYFLSDLDIFSRFDSLKESQVPFSSFCSSNTSSVVVLLMSYRWVTMFSVLYLKELLFEFYCLIAIAVHCDCIALLSTNGVITINHNNHKSS